LASPNNYLAGSWFTFIKNDVNCLGRLNEKLAWQELASALPHADDPVLAANLKFTGKRVANVFVCYNLMVSGPLTIIFNVVPGKKSGKT